MTTQVFENVWYLPDENKWRDLNPLAFKDVGRLSVSPNRLEFQGKQTHVVIDNIKGISFGKQGRDFVNSWVRIEYGEVTATSTAFFADGNLLGWGGVFGGTRKILEAIRPVSKTDVTPTPRRSVPLWAQILVWVGLLGLLALLGVGLLRTQQGTIQVGQAVDDFELAFFDGFEYNSQQAVNLSDLRGKVVVVNFWASWCKPCEQEAAELEEAWRYYEPTGEVVFLGVDYVDTEPEARSYLAKFEITFPNGADKGTRISQYFRIEGVPETYVIDRQGVLRETQIGPFQSVEDIKAMIDQLLAEE